MLERTLLLEIVLKKALTAGAPFCGVGPLAVFGRWVSSRFLSAASESFFKFNHCMQHRKRQNAESKIKVTDINPLLLNK